MFIKWTLKSKRFRPVSVSVLISVRHEGDATSSVKKRLFGQAKMATDFELHKSMVKK